ncbi:hypothetical protein FRC14_002761 [Serendipita sp. 396]|nr:hypothetical protein FRC14_002761 [Serendipita sp. 396]KAG8789695.1 hypothetical protein FRC15_003764 [Serendipita sp. 397]KAG8803983.1 hypothetical protein FRC16_001700 [Serendipita sp. 398]
MTVPFTTHEANGVKKALWNSFRVEHGFITMNPTSHNTRDDETDEIILLENRCNLLSLKVTSHEEHADTEEVSLNQVDTPDSSSSIRSVHCEGEATFVEFVAEGRDQSDPKPYPSTPGESGPTIGTEAQECVFRTTYLSRFLAKFPNRYLPILFMGASFQDIAECALQVVRAMMDPSSQEAQHLIRNSPDVVLYSQQFYLAYAYSKYIEERAQRVLLKEYQWDRLYKLGGPEKTYEWLHGGDRQDSQQNRRRRAQRGRLNLRKRIATKIVRQGRPTGRENEVGDVCE